MGAISGKVALAPHERLASIFRPDRRVIERRGVPDDLHVDLRKQHGEVGRTLAAALDLGAGGCDVAPVVIGVEVLAIPALREPDVGHDAAGARLSRHRALADRPAGERRQAGVGQRAGLCPVL